MSIFKIKTNKFLIGIVFVTLLFNLFFLKRKGGFIALKN